MRDRGSKQYTLRIDNAMAESEGHNPSGEEAPMERKTAHDFDQELLVLFDAYVHGAIDRRTFLDKAAKFAVGGVTAMMLLDQLSPSFAAQVVGAEDKRIEAKHLEYESPKGYGKARGYFVRPAEAKGKLPGVLV